MKTSLQALLGAGMSLLLGAASARAETVVSPPIGLLTITVAPGTGTAKQVTNVSFPLAPQFVPIQGRTVGKVTAIGANTVTDSAAGWAPGGLSSASSPFLLRFLSGAAQGLTLVISTQTANTATTLTIDPSYSAGVNLTTLGIVAGDTFELMPADTLLTFIGTPLSSGVVGGQTATEADTIRIFTGTWNTYFYKINPGGFDGWVRNTFGLPNANNVIIPPDALISYERIGTAPFVFNFDGRVPVTTRRVAVSRQVVTPLGSGWPMDRTLQQLGVKDLPLWVSGASATAADTLSYSTSTGTRVYFYNGTNWRRSAFGNPVADSEVIPAGSGFIVTRVNPQSGVSILAQPLPYNLAP